MLIFNKIKRLLNEKNRQKWRFFFVGKNSFWILKIGDPKTSIKS